MFRMGTHKGLFLLVGMLLGCVNLQCFNKVNPNLILFKNCCCKAEKLVKKVIYVMERLRLWVRILLRWSAVLNHPLFLVLVLELGLCLEVPRNKKKASRELILIFEITIYCYYSTKYWRNW